MSVLVPERPFVRAVGDEPLPGYRLIAPLGQGGYGEVWKCIAPGGLHKAIKFVYHDATETGETDSLLQEYEAFERIKGIRHPFLLSLERVELNGGELITVMELAEKNLAQCFEEHQASGRPGIPRDVLLSYMVDAAEVLDVLGCSHQLQHLDIKPANLFLMGGHTKVGDYGLVSRFRLGGGDEPDSDRGLTPRYVAPEILSGRIDSRSDQYSLALVYQELLTGKFPYSGRTVRQLLSQHTSGEPDLSPLPVSDREAVRRALSKDPAQRYPTCLAFVKGIMREDLAGTSGNIALSAMSRALPAGNALPLHQTPPPAVFRDSSSLSATQNLNPASTMRLGGALELEKHGDLVQFCPEMAFIEDIESGNRRGKRVRASDPTGRTQRVLMLRLDSGIPAELDQLAAMLAQPIPGVHQIARRASAKNIAFLCPDEYRPLRELGSVATRTDAFAILHSIAQSLDALHARYTLPHGLLSVSTIVSDGDGFAITEYGVGALLLKSRANTDWLDHEPYAAPEMAKGMPLPSSDQFSLAIVFLEMIGAWTAPSRKRIGQGDRGSLNPNIKWNLLTPSETVAVKRALASYPPDRFGSCAEFVAAVRNEVAAGVSLEEVQPIVSVARLRGGGAGDVPKPTDFAVALLRAAGAATVLARPTSEGSLIIAQLPDGRLTARFPVNYSEGIAALKIEAFCQELRLEVTKTADGVYLKPRFNPNESGTFAGVELAVRFPSGELACIGEIEVIGRATNERDADKLNGLVIGVMEQFRKALTNRTERRKMPRFHGEWVVNLYPIDDDLSVAAPVIGVCVDVSAGGFRCVLPASLPGEHAYLHFGSVAEVESSAALVRVLRSTPLEDGSFQISGHFVFA
jgi:serine/threonine protein kinase